MLDICDVSLWSNEPIQTALYFALTYRGKRNTTRIHPSPSCFRQVYLAAATVHPKKYAHGFVVLCFVVVMQSFIMNLHEVFIHIHQGCFAGTGAIVRLPQCQWSKPDGCGKISQCITTTKHSKAKNVCIFLGIYCTEHRHPNWNSSSHLLQHNIRFSHLPLIYGNHCSFEISSINLVLNKMAIIL